MSHTEITAKLRLITKTFFAGHFADERNYPATYTHFDALLENDASANQIALCDIPKPNPELRKNIEYRCVLERLDEYATNQHRCVLTVFFNCTAAVFDEFVTWIEKADECAGALDADSFSLQEFAVRGVQTSTVVGTTAAGTVALEQVK